MTLNAPGGAPPDLDADREARMLLALVDGMMVQLLTGQLDAGEAVATLGYQLDRVLGRPDQDR